MSIWIKSYFQLLFFHFIFLPQTNRQVELCQKRSRKISSMTRKKKIKNHSCVLELNLKNGPYCSRIQGPRPQTSVNNLQLTVNPSAGFTTCASTGINFPSSLNRDDWFQGLAANLSKLWLAKESVLNSHFIICTPSVWQKGYHRGHNWLPAVSLLCLQPWSCKTLDVVSHF